jgi:hypothetical protein
MCFICTPFTRLCGVARSHRDKFTSREIQGCHDNEYDNCLLCYAETSARKSMLRRNPLHWVPPKHELFNLQEVTSCKIAIFIVVVIQVNINKS